MKHGFKTTILSKLAVGLCAASVVAPAAWAQEFPTRPVTVINPYAAGGGADVLLRVLAQALSEEWKQPVVVESKPGAGGTLAAGYVARAPADGYTLLMGTTALATAPALFKKLPYDYVTSLASVSLFAQSRTFLIVRPGLGVSSVPQLFAMIKEKGAKMNYGSSGIGGIPHLAGVALNQALGVNVTHVPYQGTSPAYAAILGDQVDYLFADSSVVPAIRNATVKGLAVSSENRSAALPDLPALSEFLPGFDLSIWDSIEAPAGTPRAIIDRINASVKKALMSPSLIQHYADLGVEPKWMSPDAFATFKAGEVKKYAKLLKEGGVKAE